VVPTGFVRGVVKRFQREGDDHFIIFRCYRREPYPAISFNIFSRSTRFARV
jgi:hypothetical protein